VSSFLPVVSYDRVTGTAGVSPASSDGFTLVAVASFNFGRVAFNESGRDARGPSRSGLGVRYHDGFL
jgi:hypothetical protein